MAKLPDETDLGGLPSLNSRRPIVDYDTTSIARAGQVMGDAIERGGAALGTAVERGGSALGEAYAKGGAKIGGAIAEGGTAIGKGLNHLGEGVTHAAQGIGDYVRVERAITLAGMKADKQIAKSGLDAQFANDTDFATMRARYEKGLKDIDDRIKNGVGDNPAVAGQYEMWAGPDNAYAVGKTHAKAQAAKNNYEVASGLDRLDKLHDSALKNPDPVARKQAIDIGNDIITNLYNGGYIDPVKAVQWRRTWTTNYVTSQFEIMPPEERVKALSETATENNLEAADAAMHLTPQERSLYERHLTNLTGPGGVNNPDGSRSTLYQTSFEQDGKVYNVPTVWDGKILKPEDAIKRAEKEGLDNFPSYGSEKEAEARYQQMHSFMERDTASYLSSKGRNSLVSFLPEDKRVSMLERAKNQVLADRNRSDSQGALERYATKQSLNDDVASILATGQGGNEDEIAGRITRDFGPKAVREWQDSRSDASAIWAGSHDFYLLPDEQIDARLEEIRPKAGDENFERRQTVFDAVQKRADQVRKQRTEDPAGSVAEDPAVQKATQAVNPKDPETYKPLIAARMAAEERAGVAEESRSPITKQEALALSAPLRRMLPGQERDTLMQMGEAFKQRFGEDADQAFQYALRVHRVDAETAAVAGRVLKKLGLGGAVAPEDARAVDQNAEIKAAERAVTAVTSVPEATDEFGASSVSMPQGTPTVTQPERKPIPPAADIKELLADPSRADRFDRIHGKGSAEKILKTYGKRSSLGDDILSGVSKVASYLNPIGSAQAETANSPVHPGPIDEFIPEYIRPELIGGLGTAPIAALLQMIDNQGLSPEQLDRKPELQKQLFKKAYQEHPEMLAGERDSSAFSARAARRWTGEDVNSVMIKFNNWRKRRTGQDLTPQERVTEDFIDVRNPNSHF